MLRLRSLWVRWVAPAAMWVRENRARAWARFRGLGRGQRRGVRVALGSVCAWLVFVCLDWLAPLPPPKPYSQAVFAADGSLLGAFLAPDDKWRLRTDRARINPDMVVAILAKEDTWFYWHYGVNPVAFVRAALGNLVGGKRISGASTITMQVARLNEPGGRTYGRKLREAFRAVQYEWHYSKREILEMYLSLLPYGGNVEGVHSAAYIFFGRPPEALSLSQCVLLAVIPNRPNSLRLDMHSEAARRTRDKWLLKFQADGVRFSAAEVAAGEIAAALNEPVAATRHGIPLLAPQLCRYVLRRNARSEAGPQVEIHTTIQKAKQKLAEELLANHVRRIKPQGVTNGAVLVVDNHTGNVVAYCGSADFGDKESGGEIDGVHALRSPGSALKPVAYALGFDMGLVTPQMKLLDVPTTYQGFTPENYNPDFAGEATIHHALTHSLNVPVVRLVNDVVGLDHYLDLLVKADFAHVSAHRKQLGLSSVTGGCSVTLEEMTRLYTAFANDGNMLTLRYEEGERGDSEDANEKGKQLPTIPLFSAGATWLTANILADIERPDLPQRYIEESRLPKVAWKTGTSYGRRDAWAVGFSPDYTIGVWMGNFDNTGAAELSGATVSVPLMLDLFNAIAYDPARKWFGMPQSVHIRRVCAETGMLPAPSCSHFTNDFALAEVSSLSTCNLYQDVYVSEGENVQYCTACLPATGYKLKGYPMYPVELALWFGQNRIAYPKPPPHNPQCAARFTGDGPKILSPSADFQYFMEIGRETEIALQAAAHPTATKVYWYVNGAFYREAAPNDKVFYRPHVGPLTVTCVDNAARKSSVKVVVKGY